MPFTDPRANIVPYAAAERVRFGRSKGLQGEALNKVVDEKLEGTNREVDTMLQKRAALTKEKRP